MIKINHALHEWLVALEQQYKENPLVFSLSEVDENQAVHIPFDRVMPGLIAAFIEGQQHPATSLGVADVQTVRYSKGDEEIVEYEVKAPEGGIVTTYANEAEAAAHAASLNPPCGACESFKLIAG